MRSLYVYYTKTMVLALSDETIKYTLFTARIKIITCDRKLVYEEYLLKSERAVINVV